MPLHMFLLVDHSGSMVRFGEDRWTPVANAIRDFAAPPAMAGIGLGLNYFGFHPPGQPPTDPDAPGSCSANDYARPDVPIGVLPDVRTAIEHSLDVHDTPGGGSPTHPALLGAMQYVTSRMSVNPNRKTIVVLVTGGEPRGCTNNDFTSVAQTAAVGLANNPQIPTYVIGLGANLNALNQVAQSGGTSQAYLIEPVSSPRLLDAMTTIRDDAYGCNLLLPMPAGGKAIDFDKVNVSYPPGSEGFVFYVGSRDGCLEGYGGWYYERDVRGVPRAVSLCPRSCRGLLETGGRAEFAIGCTVLSAPWA